MAGDNNRIYSTLDASARQIRLLTIDPALDHEGRVTGKLSTASLADNDSPVYNALSWYWGDASSRKEIVLNGVSQYIPENAVEVLEKACVARECLHVWLDAVCINQDDLEERGYQVSLMEEIYAKARRVIVWLGDDGIDINKRALKSISMLKKQFLGYTDQKFGLTHESDEDAMDPTRFEIFNGQETPVALFDNVDLPTCDWLAIEHFFAAPWFQRLWVCQEVMLNYGVRCVRGTLECPWFDVGLAAKWLDFCRYWRAGYVGKRINNVDAAGGVWAFTYIMPADWANLLNLGLERKATLLVDYIYGLLGLTEKGSPSEFARSEKDLKPDYTKPLALVFAAATRVAIKSRHPYTNALNVLLGAQSFVQPLNQIPFAGIETPDGTEWPTWVPRYDWKFDPECGSPIIFNDWHGDNAAGFFRAAEMTDYSTSPLILGLDGITVSTVTTVGKVIDREMWKDSAELSREVLRWAVRAKETGMTDLDFAMTLTSRLNHLEEDAAEDPAFLQRYEAFVADARSDQASGTWSADAQLFVDALWRGSANKLVFELDDGRIGMGYPKTQVGDIVCILFSGMAPFILRHARDYCKLVGHAYVHNIMHVSGPFDSFLFARR